MPSSSSSTVGVLGGGQLGRMLVEAANRLNIQVNVLDAPNAPAKQICAHSHHVDGSFADPEAIQNLAKTVDVLTVEIEHVNTYGLEKVSQKVAVEPHWRTIRTIQNKFLQKEHLTRRNIPVAEYCEVPENTAEELGKIGKKLGFPFMLKSQTEAYDGRGNYPVESEADIPASLEALGSRPLYGEKWAHFKAELAVLVVKTKKQVLSFQTVETIHEDSICKLVFAPARNISDSLNEKAQALARDAVAGFEGKGVFAVECFLVDNEELLVNEIAPRPHNSAHHTIEACGISQFEAHLRAILDLPIPPSSLKLRGPAIMLNILGGTKPDSHLDVAHAAYEVPNASIHLYGKGDARPGRKMGHITVTGPTMAACESTIQPLVEVVDKLRAQRTKKPAAKLKPNPTDSIPASKSSKGSPTVAVIMGSGSDLHVLKPGLELLEDFFNISVEVEICSVHRIPEVQAEYSKTAASRGIKVILAAAGGAAHLPGLTATYTTLPVIGIPVKGKVLDGNDSLLSIVQMPPGIPVATMAINGSVNAALFAARILALTDEVVRRKYEDYVDSLKKKVMDSREALHDGGWTKYEHKA